MGHCRRCLYDIDTSSSPPPCDGAGPRTRPGIPLLRSPCVVVVWGCSKLHPLPHRHLDWRLAPSCASLHRGLDPGAGTCCQPVMPLLAHISRHHYSSPLPHCQSSLVASFYCLVVGWVPMLHLVTFLLAGLGGGSHPRHDALGCHPMIVDASSSHWCFLFVMCHLWVVCICCHHMSSLDRRLDGR